MFRFVCKSIHSFAPPSEPQKSNILRLQQFSSSKSVNEHSFPVRYLVHEFGFSLQKALLASNKLKFQTADKPDAVVSFFKNQGFTHSQIQKLISSKTRVLAHKPQTTLLPKIQFLRSKGVSSTDLARMVVGNVQLLTRSLKNHIEPTFNSLKDVVGSDEAVILMLKADSNLLNYTGNHVNSIIQILRGAGVPYSMITALLKTRTRLFCYGPDKLKESIEQVRELGMDPQRWNYILALYVLTVIPRSKWNGKMEAYKKWGCSEDEVLASFKIQPRVMTLTVEKINRVMSFCVNEIGWEPSEVVARRYDLLTWSLDKRIMPRWAVYQELLSKRLVKEEGELTAMFKMREKLFLEKYVNCYENDAPLLLKVYCEKCESSK